MTKCQFYILKMHFFANIANKIIFLINLFLQFIKKLYICKIKFNDNKTTRYDTRT